MGRKTSGREHSAEGETLRKAVAAYLDARQAASDAVQWRDWDSVEDLEREERDALVALANLVGWEEPDDDPEAFWGEEEDGVEELSESPVASDMDALVAASIERVASETYPDGVVYRECGCRHVQTMNWHRLCSYHEGYTDGVEEGRRAAFAEPGTVDWSKRKPFPEGHVGVEGVDTGEVASFLDAVGRRGTDAEESDTASLMRRPRGNDAFYADLAADNLINPEKAEQLERLIITWADARDAANRGEERDEDDGLSAEKYAQAQEIALRKAVGR